MAWGGISVCGKKASQDIPLGKKMGHLGLDCCHANASEHDGHLSQEPGKHIPPAHCPQRKEQNGGNVTLGSCVPASMLLNFLPYLLNKKQAVAKERLLVLEDFGPA